MFVRVKTNPNSPRKSVQIVHSCRIGDKVRQKIIKHVGVANNEEELIQLKLLAETIKIRLENEGQELLFSPEILAENIIKAKAEKDKEKYSDDDYNVNIKELREECRIISGIHDIYGKLFDELHLRSIFSDYGKDVSILSIFKDIVLARIANPVSKAKSVSMLEEKFGISLDLDKVYRMMDKIDDEAIKRLNEIAYRETLGLFGGKIDVIFFDATTLYFESFTEDEFRRNGYSKDLKFNQPQVLIALMVTKEGLPIGYKAFSGDTYEGHTLIPALKALKKQYKLDKVVYVADSGMFNRDNIEELETLENNEFNYIVGARIKSMPKTLREQILNPANYSELDANTKIATFDYKGRKLLVTHSLNRARKDKADREKGIEKLRNKLKKHKTPKEYLSNQGYKKYLQVEGKSKISLNEEKIREDAMWDGLKGLLTNKTNLLTNEEILHQYSNLWYVEESFRITKHDLRIRPIYHYKESRVKAHLAISFVAYMLVRYLEYRVKLQYKKLSPERIRQMLISIQTSILVCNKKRIRYGIPSRMSIETKKIYRLMNVKRTTTPFIIKKF